MSKFNIKKIDNDELITIINFIEQEAYRLAVIKQYPDDVSRIYNLSKSVRHEIIKLFAKYVHIDPVIEKIILTVVSYIVTKSPFDQFKEEINNLIDKWWEFESDYEDNVEVKKSDNAIEDTVDLRKRLQNVVVNLCKKNQEFQCNIVHKYPVAMFAIELNKGFLSDYYHGALEYFYDMKYIPIKHGHLIEQEDFNHKESMRINRCPYHVFSPIVEQPQYKNPPYNIDCEYKRVEVPTDALSKMEGNIEIELSTKNLAKSYLMLQQYRCREQVYLTSELTVRIDVSKALSDNELDRILSCLRSDISNVQESNIISHMCLAKTEDELVARYETSRQHIDNHSTMNVLHSYITPKYIINANARDARDALGALILISEHFVKYTYRNDEVTVSWNKDNSLQRNMESLSEELSAKHGRKSFSSKEGKADYSGFSAGMIERGYKELSKLIKTYLDDFQKGRVQFDKKLNQLQRKKLRTEMEISLEQLHPDDRARAESELEKYLKSGRKASIKPLKNGSYVITPD